MLKHGKCCRKWGKENKIKGMGAVVLTFNKVVREGLIERMTTPKA